MQIRPWHQVMSVILIVALQLVYLGDPLTALAAMQHAIVDDFEIISPAPINCLADLLPQETLTAIGLDQQRPVELISRRSASGKHFLREDGSNVAIFSMERMHYQDAAGDWHEIDNTIVPYKDKQFTYRNKSNNLLFLFSDQKPGNPVRWQIADSWLEMELVNAEASTAVLDANTIYYPESYPGVGLKFTAQTDALKQSLVFHAPPEQTRFTFYLTTEGLTLREEQGLIGVYSNKDEELLSALAPPFLIDANEQMNHWVSQELTKSSTGYKLVYTIDDPEWLHAKDRVYPVELDPSLLFSLDEDTYTQENYPTTSAWPQQFLYVGFDDGTHGNPAKDRTRTFLRFDMSDDISPYVNIQAAYLGLYRNTNPMWGNTNRIVNLHRVTENISVRQITWNNSPAWSSKVESSITFLKNDTRRTYEWTITDLVQGWADGSFSNYGVCIKMANENQQAEVFASSNHGNLNENRHPPYLVVEYEDPGQNPPTVSITSPTAGQIIRGQLTLRANASHISGIDRVEFDVNGETLVASTAPFTVQWDSTSASDGPLTISATAIDNLGNRTSVSVNIIVDNTSPTLHVTSPPENAQLGGVVYISGTAADSGSGIQTTEVHINGELKANYSASSFDYAWNTLVMEDGPAEVTVVARDTAGNEVSRVIPVEIANQTYTVSILSPENNAFIRGTQPVEVSATGAVTKLELYIDGELKDSQASAPYRFNLDTTQFPDGMHTLTVTSYGYTGDPVESDPSTITIDNTVPALVISWPGPEAILSGIAQITYAAQDQHGIDRVEAEYRNLGTGRTGQIFASKEAEQTLDWDISGLLDGKYRLTFHAYDKAGNSTTKAIDVNIENVPDSSGLYQHHTYTLLSFAGHNLHVNVATGNLLLQALETETSGGPLRAVALRTFNQHSGWLSFNGRGNNLNYAFLYDAGNDYINLVDFSGAKLRFTPDGKGGYHSPTGVTGKLNKYVDGTFTYSDDQEAITYKFNGTGQLTGIQDLNGNVIKYIYDVQDRLIRMESATGQQIVFRYNPQGVVRQTENNAGKTIKYTYNDDLRLTAITNALGDTAILTYDDSGRLATITDEANETMSLAWEGNQVRALTAPDGSVNSFSYNPKEQLTTHTNPRGDRTEYTYDQYGRVTKKKDYVGDVAKKAATLLLFRSLSEEHYTTTYVYDDEHNLTSTTDPSGHNETFTYNEYGNLVSHTDAAGRTTTYEYNDLNKLTTVTDSAGSTTTMDYDDRGNLTVLRDAEGNEQKYTYDSSGNLIQETDPVGRTNEYSYDEGGHLVKHVDAIGGQHDYVYDKMGNVLQYTDPAGHTTSCEYDDLDRVTKVTDTEGNTTTYVYDNSKREMTVTDAQESITSFQFNYQNQIAQSVAADGTITEYEYDGTGNMTELRTGDKSQSYEYDRFGRLTAHIDAGNNRSQYRWDRAGNLTQTRDATGAVHSYRYDELGRLTQVTDPMGNFQGYEYDESGNLRGITDALGNITRFEHDSLGRVTRLTTPQGESQRYKYDEAGRLVRIITADGLVIDYTYDDLDRIAREQNSLSEDRRYIYDAAGNLISITDELNQTWQFEYDALGRVISMTDPTGQKESYTYDDLGKLIAKIVPGQGAWRYEYDKLGRLVKETDSSDGVTEYEYDANGNIVAMTSFSGARTQYIYNALGQLIQLIDPAGNSYYYKYDEIGNLIYQEDPLGNIYRYRYNPAGWLIEVIDPLDGVTTIQYDAVGNPVKITDAAGNDISYDYDSYGNLVKETDALGQVISYLYDSQNRLTQRTDPRGLATSYSYDEAGHMIQMQTPEDTRTFNYPQQQLQLIESRGETTYTHNYSGHLINKNHPWAGDLSYSYQEGQFAGRALGNYHTTFNYLGNGHLESVDTPGGTVNYLRDSYYRLAGHEFESGWRATYELNPSYQVTGLTIADNEKVMEQIGYQRDALGRIATESGRRGSTDYEYDPLGRLKKATYPGSRSEEFIYDAVSNLLEITSAGETVASYQYDEANQLTKATYHTQRGGFYNSQARALVYADSILTYDESNLLEAVHLRTRNNQSFKYDDTNRRISYQTSAGERTIVYENGLPDKELDAAGEIVLQYNYTPDGTPKTLTYKEKEYTIEYTGDKLLLFDDTGNQQAYFAFDQWGRLKGRFGPLAGIETYLLYSRHVDEKNTNERQYYTGGIYPDPLQGKEVDFQYDEAGNLTARTSETSETRYSYDSENNLTGIVLPDGRAISYTYNALGYRDSKTTSQGTVSYIYDGNKIIAEQDENDEIIAWYSYDLYGKLVSVTYGDDTYFYHFNHRGDTLYLTDEDGNIAAEYLYDAWGNILAMEGELANKNPHRYKGRYGYYYDTDAELYLLSSRWYMPEIRRFLTRDDYRGEVADPISMHRYAYCGNDPVNYVDPMGTYGMVATINGGGGGSSSLGRSYEPELPLGPMWDIPDMGNTGQASRSTNTSSTNRNTGSNTTRTTTSTQRPNTSSPQPAPAKTSGSPPPPQPKPDRSKIFSGGLSGILGGIAIGVGIAALTVATGGLALPTIIAAGTIVSGAGLVAYGGMEIGEGITGKNPVRDFVGDDIYYTGYMLASTGSVLGTGYCSMYVRMYGPGAQPVQVVGKPHGSAQHQKIIMDKVKELEQTGKYSKIFVNKALNTAGFNGTQRPDIIAVAKNGIAHIFEVASPSQLAGKLYSELLGKVDTMLRNNPGMEKTILFPEY